MSELLWRFLEIKGLVYTVLLLFVFPVVHLLITCLLSWAEITPIPYYVREYSGDLPLFTELGKQFVCTSVLSNIGKSFLAPHWAKYDSN